MSSSLPPLPLPAGLTEQQVNCPAAGLNFHTIEAGYTSERTKPLVLLLHGFPELAFSWRKIMPALAAAGNYVVAVDQRGYGRTTGWDNSPFAQTDLSQFQLTRLARDMVILVNALGYDHVTCLVGHDFGAVSASMCALIRPDFFRALVLMSHPFKGSPKLPFNYAHNGPNATPEAITGGGAGKNIQGDLAALPEPRKHYKWYNSTEPAANDWLHPQQGLHTFLRGYLHLKSADWDKNDPKPLKAWEASEVAKMPHYYIMPLKATMPEAVALNMQGEDEGKTKRWMSDEDLAIYVQEWSRTGFQGGLNWYRAQTDPTKLEDLDLFAGKRIEVPSTFVSGDKDWGNYQQPGAIETFDKSCSDFRGSHFISGAGHWPQQEQPQQVANAILTFMKNL